MTKQRAVKLKLNRTFTEKEYDVPDHDPLHIKDGEKLVEFAPACVFDEEDSQSGGKLKRLKRLVFLVPALVVFILAANSEKAMQIYLFIGGFVALIIGMVAIAVTLLLKKKPRKLLLFVDGCLKALTFNDDTTGLQIAWTQDEAKEYVRKQIALEQEKYKPLKTWQFIVIIAFLVFILIFLLRIASTIGAL